jgi:hypothetical protein
VVLGASPIDRDEGARVVLADSDGNEFSELTLVERLGPDVGVLLIGQILAVRGSQAGRSAVRRKSDPHGAERCP